MEFMICKKCGNLITFAGDFKSTGLTCCGENMILLNANTTDASQEKHVPVIRTSGNTVTVCVGSAAHPMTPEHFIGIIAIETSQGKQIKPLKAGDEPKAVFALAEGESFKAAYAYCNLHGLWKA